MEITIKWTGKKVSFVVSEKAKEMERIEKSFSSDDDCISAFLFLHEIMKRLGEKLGLSQIPAETLLAFGARDKDTRGEIVFFSQ